jgi:hypothetical protein
MQKITLSGGEAGYGIDSDIHAEVDVAPFAQLEMMGIIGVCNIPQCVLFTDCEISDSEIGLIYPFP